MPPKKAASADAKGPEEILSSNEMRVLSLAWLAMDAKPQIDFEKLAKLAGHTNKGSTRNSYAAAMKKLAAHEVKTAIKNGGSDDASEDSGKGVTTLVTKSAPTPAKKSRVAAAAAAAEKAKAKRALEDDDDDDDDDAEKPAPKKRGRKAKAAKFEPEPEVSADEGEEDDVQAGQDVSGNERADEGDDEEDAV